MIPDPDKIHILSFTPTPDPKTTLSLKAYLVQITNPDPDHNPDLDIWAVKIHHRIMDSRKVKISNFAKDRQRDEKGHFIKVTTKVETPLDAFDPGLDAGPGSSEDNIVDFKVKNPLGRITRILEDIKKRQMTSFAIKFSVPLVALPVFLLIVFQLGRAQTTCAEQYATKLGTFEVISVHVPEKQGFLRYIFSFLPNIPNLTPKDKLLPETRAILIRSNTDPLNVLYDTQIPIINFKGQSVIITGNYSACTNTITLDSSQNILPDLP